MRKADNNSNAQKNNGERSLVGKTKLTRPAKQGHDKTRLDSSRIPLLTFRLSAPVPLFPSPTNTNTLLFSFCCILLRPVFSLLLVLYHHSNTSYLTQVQIKHPNTRPQMMIIPCTWTPHLPVSSWSDNTSGRYNTTKQCRRRRVVLTCGMFSLFPAQVLPPLASKQKVDKV